MNYAAMIAALIALGISVSVIVAQDGVTVSKDGFCHRDVKLDGNAICLETEATIADSSTNICITPYIPNKCP